jgi:hypothetical protein
MNTDESIACAKPTNTSTDRLRRVWSSSWRWVTRQCVGVARCTRNSPMQADTMSDHMLRDVGLKREATDPWAELDTYGARGWKPGRWG